MRLYHINLSCKTNMFDSALTRVFALQGLREVDVVVVNVVGVAHWFLHDGREGDRGALD